MVTLLLDSTQLEVVLSGSERLMSFHHDNIAVPRETIAKVQLSDDVRTWLRGTPSPGTYVRGVVAMGTWTSAAGEDDFVMVRGRKPGVVIDLDGHDDYRRLLLTTRHGLSLVKALRLDVDGPPEDVADLAG